MRIAVTFALLLGCASSHVPITPLPPVESGVEAVAPIGAHCGSPPAVSAVGFRHEKSRVLSHGHAEHRGDDLMAIVGEDQRITGRLGYTHADRPIADEAVEILACVETSWVSLGTTRTADDGRFALVVASARGIAAGLTELYLRVPGDATGAAFLAFVAPRGAPIVIVDVDGTLTASENAIVTRGLIGRAIAAQPDAPAALAHAPGQIVYVTARGEHFANATRRWLDEHGFPRGPTRFAPGLFARPGAASLTAKKRVLAELAGRFTFAAGIGNRASDVAAYREAGIAPEHIYMKLPQFEQELAPLLAAHAAVGFSSYAALAF